MFVNRLRNCRVYTGPVIGSILIEEVENCLFVLASHQIMRKVVVFIWEWGVGWKLRIVELWDSRRIFLDMRGLRRIWGKLGWKRRIWIGKMWMIWSGLERLNHRGGRFWRTVKGLEEWRLRNLKELKRSGECGGLECETSNSLLCTFGFR